MRTEQEMLELISRVAKDLGVQAVALSGSRANPSIPKDSFQDYDVLYVLENFEHLMLDSSWLDRFGYRLIEQRNTIGHRRLFLMLLEDGNRIDLTLCPRHHLDEWVQSESSYLVLRDPEDLFSRYSPHPRRYWVQPATEEKFQQSCNEFWWVSTYVVKGICRKELVYATDHLYSICQQELLKILAWQVANDKGTVDVGKNYKHLFAYLPAEKECEVGALLDFTSFENITSSLMRTQEIFYRESQKLAKECHFQFDQQTADMVMKYTRKTIQKYNS